MKKFPLRPKNPERICWGCDQYCAVDAMSCGNGAERTPHPVELFGDDWQEWQPLQGGNIPVNAVSAAAISNDNEADRIQTDHPVVVPCAVPEYVAI